MDNNIKNAIDSRKSAILNSYDITDAETKERVETLFAKMSEFGEKCKNINDFENKLSKDSLNQEYMELFSHISQTCKPIATNNTEEIETSKGQFKSPVSIELDYSVRRAAIDARREVNQEAFDKARKIPVLSQILQAKQYINFFSRFKKKKDDK